jgi:predicted nucleotidyltransferase
MTEVNPFQEAVLRYVADFAARYHCVVTIYVFGSVARGEIETAHDVDLAVEYLDMDQLVNCADSYTAFQAAFDDWAKAGTKLFGKPFIFSRVHIKDPDDDAWRAIKLAAKTPVARIGKAILAATPRHAPKPGKSAIIIP